MIFIEPVFSKCQTLAIKWVSGKATEGFFIAEKVTILTLQKLVSNESLVNFAKILPERNIELWSAHP